MSKTATLATLIQRRDDLTRQLKKTDAAIRIARQREAQERHAKVLSMLEAKGLLDADLAQLSAALEQVDLKPEHTSPAQEPEAA